jgi:two-component sensor histidine kinase
LLIAELDHRVKNMLATVAAVCTQTRQDGTSIDDFAKALDGRIQSMATAHLLLSKSRWRGVGLMELVRHQLAPYATENNTIVNGPDIMLSAAATQAVAMVFHELATNAAKYGALSASGGRVSVTWDRTNKVKPAASVVVEWREIGGPAIGASISPGFGTSLIRELIPHELGGTVELSFPSDGVRCTIEFPVDHQ